MIPKEYIVHLGNACSNATELSVVVPDRKRAVGFAKDVAARRQAPVDMTAIYHDHAPQTECYFPDGHCEMRCLENG